MIEIIPNWHPVFVHFPIAFATAAVVFFAAALIFKGKPWAAQSLITGRWMLWAAAIFACIAAVFGWFAYNSVEHDDAGHLAMTTHAYWALSALSILVLLAVLDVRSRGGAAKSSLGFLILLIVGWSVVISTAWHGGELVYRHGLGVMSLPEPEGLGHTHEHGTGHDAMPEHHENASLEDGHADGNDDTMIGVGATPTKSGHTHAPGSPLHKD